MGMFGAGHLGDRIHLRKFLTFGMLASGIMVCSVGLAYFLEIHSIWYFVVVQIIGGVLPLPKNGFLCPSLKLKHVSRMGLFLQAPKGEHNEMRAVQHRCSHVGRKSLSLLHGSSSNRHNVTSAHDIKAC